MKDTKRFTSLRIRKQRQLNHLAFLLRCRDTNIPLQCIWVKYHNTPKAQRIIDRTRERVEAMRRELARCEAELYHLHLQLTRTLTPADWQNLDDISYQRMYWEHTNTRRKHMEKYNELAAKFPKDDFEKGNSTVINLSSKQLDAATTISLLAKGLNFAITPQKKPIPDIVAGVETAIQHLPREKVDNIRYETSRILKTIKLPPSNLDRTNAPPYAA
ncbi:hypothetical protein ANN_01060 [Periplaneta americana]|uniref:Uncharacterized protein n=1 Tax=Periplaneta americana TaxID=6978 RepID=A0ABQ8TUY4_PERAM|nr:hypothetical protein ANN_01060 [Periplaneta americana]